MIPHVILLIVWLRFVCVAVFLQTLVPPVCLITVIHIHIVAAVVVRVGSMEGVVLSVHILLVLRGRVGGTGGRVSLRLPHIIARDRISTPSFRRSVRIRRR